MGSLKFEVYEFTLFELTNFTNFKTFTNFKQYYLRKYWHCVQIAFYQLYCTHTVSRQIVLRCVPI